MNEPGRVVTFDRSEFLRSQQVRVSGGTIVKVSGMKRRQSRRLGYSYSALINRQNGSQDEVLLSRVNLGKRGSRTRSSNLNQKLRGKSTFEIHEGLNYAVASVIYTAAGIAMLGMVAVVGEFYEEGFNERYGEKKRG
jgi:hypothetical protein